MGKDKIWVSNLRGETGGKDDEDIGADGRWGGGGELASGLWAYEAGAAAEAEMQVVDTVKAVFVAAGADDLGKFHEVTTTDFYAYDNGMRFDGDALMQAIQKQHAAGYVYEWNVTQPEVHVAGMWRGSVRYQ